MLSTELKGIRYNAKYQNYFLIFLHFIENTDHSDFMICLFFSLMFKIYSSSGSIYCNAQSSILLSSICCTGFIHFFNLIFYSKKNICFLFLHANFILPCIVFHFTQEHHINSLQPAMSSSFVTQFSPVC
jgi:hypothetical protein